MDVLVLVFIIGGVLLLLSIDGMRLVFRGTRDYTLLLGASSVAARLAATIAALALAVTGAAALVSLIAGLGGVRLLGRWANPNDPVTK